MTDSVFVDLLEKELETPISTAKKSYRVLHLCAMGLISIGREQYTISKELYGNGVPGGIKQAVSNTQKDIADLTKLIKSPVSPIPLPPPPPQKADSFDGLVKWIVDKILPTLVIGVVLSIIQALLWFWAMQNGLITIS